MTMRLLNLLTVGLSLSMIMPAFANTEATGKYRVQPGDVLDIAVWREADLHMEVLVRPDGGISLPLIGELGVSGKNIPQLRQELLTRYGKFIPDTDVAVSIKQLSGNKVYVIGKVARPGEFIMLRPMDVMQVLSMAGGVTPFAAVNDIKILRRNDAFQQVFSFEYSVVEDGRGLEQNILLESGDVIIVP